VSSSGADEIRLPSPEAVADLAGRELTELDRLVRLDRLVAEHAAEARAYVSDLYRLRRATIRDIVDSEGLTDAEAAHRPAHRRRVRVGAVAERLGITETQVYQALRTPLALA
jgi:hypothetical protein